MLHHLWIMRHGLAVDQFESDFSRELSKEGERQAENSIKQVISDSASNPSQMLVSPFTRTKATADIAHRILGLTSPYQTEEMLVHFADHKILGDFLLASNFQDLLIVSHMPIVAKLCQYLAPGCDIFGFQTAQIVRLDFIRQSEQENNTSAVAHVGAVYKPQ